MSSTPTAAITADNMFEHINTIFDQEEAFRHTARNVPGYGPLFSRLDLSQRCWGIGRPRGWICYSKRDLYKGAFDARVRQLAAEWLSESDGTILEIGAGKLNDNGRSYLSAGLPNKVAKLILYTDPSPDVAVGNVQRARAIEISSVVDAVSLDGVVACCALDCLRYSDLPLAMKEVAKALKPNGVLISVSDLPPFSASLCDSLVKDDFVLFPSRNASNADYRSGVQVIKHERLQAFIDDSSQRFESTEKAVLQRFASADAALTEDVMSSIKGDTAELLSSYLDFRKIPGMCQVHTTSRFHKAFRSSLTGAGLQIKQFNYITSVEIRKFAPGENRSINYYLHSPAGGNSFKIYVLKPEYVCFHLAVHVVVAQKTLPSTAP